MKPALRAIVLGLGLAVAFGGRGSMASAAERAVPRRIMSTNVCTDLLLLELAPKSRIASVTFLAPQAARALFPGATDGIPLNHNSAEDVVNFRPDLILDSGLSSPLVRTLARRVGARVVDVKDANNFNDIRDSLRQVGAAVGEPARAQALIAHMDAILADLAAHPPARRLRVVAWSGGSAVPGKGSLTDAIITAAGAVNIAARPGVAESSFGVEELLAADPDALLYGGATLGRPSLLTDEGQHRIVRQRFAGRRIAYNDIAHTCGLPQSADAARDLRQALDALPPRTRAVRSRP
ncbi:MAG TPA: ABC transporter substrate-binding protein [Phenylobacterium sp.]|jgi:iron complex transport system substrate-binding protein|uniref:ABC transporter substrate-binding protein n=1 Tax=Phenylobacterium sp. TaxID=1871053 RepID=UPI002D6A6CE9|nr:ABC transporter substrate-binding protein [Phenylobacterium sp.]HZZ66932.1 ABC transporter substrate-binding protein [Phenylobacterium sp.]